MLLALCFIPAILVLLVVFLITTFLQVCIASAVSRFGCCCYVDNTALDGSTARVLPSASASTPPVPASGGGQGENRQQVLQQLQQMREARRRSASGCTPGAVRNVDRWRSWFVRSGIIPRCD
jgi:hypothetical protein